jgi:hypothetical protein
MTGKWTPSVCKSTNATTALVDKSIETLSGQVKDKPACKEYYRNWQCDKVKADLDCSWACAYNNMAAQISYDCNAKTACATNGAAPQLVKCSSWVEALTAVCDKTAAEITKIVADGKASGGCSDDGFAFSPTPVQTTPAPAKGGSGLLSATWALVLTAPVVAFGLLV